MAVPKNMYVKNINSTIFFLFISEFYLIPTNRIFLKKCVYIIKNISHKRIMFQILPSLKRIDSIHRLFVGSIGEMVKHLTNIQFLWNTT